MSLVDCHVPLLVAEACREGIAREESLHATQGGDLQADINTVDRE